MKDRTKETAEKQGPDMSLAHEPLLGIETLEKDELFLLGHKITLYKGVSGDFDFAMGETPPNVPGPPPHYHNLYDETFFILEGEMEFLIEGRRMKAKTGEIVNVPKNAVHTFRNVSHGSCKWFNIHAPKGFSSFFKNFGIPVSEDSANEKSVDEVLIKRVIQQAADFDMILAR